MAQKDQKEGKPLAKIEIFLWGISIFAVLATIMFWSPEREQASIDYWKKFDFGAAYEAGYE